MRIVEFSAPHGAPIHECGSHAVTKVHLDQGAGQSHVYGLHFERGGAIGAHRTGFDQLFLVVSGAGWIAGPDGKRQRLETGQGACLQRGEVHSKGSEDGMTVIMVEAEDLL